jgi:hypothetical protein
VAALRERVERTVAVDLDRETERRGRLADGMRRALRFEGPWNLGKLARVVFASHRDDVVGEPVVDVRSLSESDLRRPEAEIEGDGFLDYLASPLRRPVERALRRLAESNSSAGAESAFRVLRADLEWLEGRFGPVGEADARRVVASAAEASEAVRAVIPDFPPLLLDADEPLAPQAAAYRKRLAAQPLGWPESRHGVSLRGAPPASDVTRDVLDRAVDAGLREALRARDESLRRLQFDVEAALSQALAKESTALDMRGR